MMNDDEEYEEESSYVVLDLGNEITMDAVERLAQEEGGVTIAGMNEMVPTPIVQIGDLTFQGELDELLGTSLFFEINDRKHDTSGLLPLLSSMRTEDDDSPRQPTVTTTFACSTSKIFKCEKVELIPREHTSDQEPSNGLQDAREDPLP